MDYFYICILLLLYILFDVHYFLRTILTFLFSKLFRSRIEITDASTMYGIVLPSDIDSSGGNHMNNARILRELDFCRLDHATRAGLLPVIIENKSAASGHLVRYRQPLMLFSTYKIITRPIYWENRILYIEQRFITLKDNMVRCLVYTSFGLRFDFDEYCTKNLPFLRRPHIPEEIEKWIAISNLSSDKLRTERNGKGFTNKMQ